MRKADENGGGNRLERGNCDSKLSGVWLECKCHHFAQRTWASQQCSLFQTFLNLPIYILYFWTLFWNNLSINIYQIPFLFSVSETLQKCFPNPSIPPSFPVIISRLPHVLAACGVPKHFASTTSLSTPPGPKFPSCSGHDPRLGGPGTTVKLTTFFFFFK